MRKGKADCDFVVNKKRGAQKNVSLANLGLARFFGPKNPNFARFFGPKNPNFGLASLWLLHGFPMASQWLPYSTYFYPDGIRENWSNEI